MVYGTSGIKRKRRTNADIQRVKDTLVEIIAQQRPITCRQAFYQLVARQAIEKTQQEYQNVCRYLTSMRREGAIGYDAIADNTRWMRKPKSHFDLKTALQYTHENYRKMLWADQPVYVEVWCESDSVAGVLFDITGKFDVPLHAMRGFASETYLHSLADFLRDEERPIFIYYFGDYDPSGVWIDKDAEKKVRAFAPHLNITFKREAVTKEQIEKFNLPGAPPKKSDSRASKFDHSESVEIETFSPGQLRKMVRNSIVRHINQQVYEQTKNVENLERQTLAAVIEGLYENEQEEHGDDESSDS